ncbi:MAG: ribonuclease R [Alphaproteobacteria bacterium]
MIKHSIKGYKAHYADITQIIKQKVDQPKSLSIIALEDHNVPYEFSSETLSEIKKIQEITPKNSESKRQDLTHLPFITIDPKDARDHDDAIYTELDADTKGDTKGSTIYVAIADVSAYVKSATALDNEAQLRGNSTYLPDKVVPMLPEYLSNNLCSLKANNIKPVIVVKITINADGKKTEHEFMRAFINCRANLTYEDVHAASLDLHHKAYSDYQEAIIQPLIKTYHLLEIAHKKRAPLDLDLPEYRIILNDQCEPTHVDKKERLFTHRLIEEFMVLANVCAAETLADAEFPVTYRSHDEPTAEKIAALRETLKELDIPLKKSNAIKPAFFNTLLRAAQGTEIQDMISKMVLRCQSQAIYNTSNDGHFGLNLKQYVHFTSPIRRYADLLVHRSLIHILKMGNDGLMCQEIEAIPDICQHISTTERRSMKAEMDTKDRFLAELLKNKISQNFSAGISGITNAGIFVRLPDYGAEGFLPIRYLSQFGRKKRYFETNETRHILRDKYSGQYYRIGQKIHVSLLEVDLLTGNMIFTLVDENDINNGDTHTKSKNKKHGKSDKIDKPTNRKRIKAKNNSKKKPQI